MSLELTISIPDNSPQEYNINSLAEAEHISREEAVLRLLATPKRTSQTAPDAFSIIGAGRDDAELIDEIMELVMSDRQKHNAEPPRVS